MSSRQPPLQTQLCKTIGDAALEWEQSFGGRFSYDEALALVVNRLGYRSLVELQIEHPIKTPRQCKAVVDLERAWRRHEQGLTPRGPSEEAHHFVWCRRWIAFLGTLDIDILTVDQGPGHEQKEMLDVQWGTTNPHEEKPRRQLSRAFWSEIMDHFDAMGAADARKKSAAFVPLGISTWMHIQHPGNEQTPPSVSIGPEYRPVMLQRYLKQALEHTHAQVAAAAIGDAIEPANLVFPRKARL